MKELGSIFEAAKLPALFLIALFILCVAINAPLLWNDFGVFILALVILGNLSAPGAEYNLALSGILLLAIIVAVFYSGYSATKKFKMNMVSAGIAGAATIIMPSLVKMIIVLGYMATTPMPIGMSTGVPVWFALFAAAAGSLLLLLIDAVACFFIGALGGWVGKRDSAD